MEDTRASEYTDRLVRLQQQWWKRAFDVQAPYRWNIRRLKLGRTLDIGCGIGRNLSHLNGDGVGLDHNAMSVDVARAQGLVAYTPAEFSAAPECRPGAFDSLLLSHVAEHMDEDACSALVGQYLELLRPHGRVVLITPQEAGQRSDPTHLTFVDFAVQRRVLERVNCTVERQYSFPLPRAAGRFFVYNEFVAVGRRQG
jgi:2-polyprenyl-3-methyl-5-hydroxy-6-metoxy-1,4-benzoquinol methylase